MMNASDTWTNGKPMRWGERYASQRTGVLPVFTGANVIRLVLFVSDWVASRQELRVSVKVMFRTRLLAKVVGRVRSFPNASLRGEIVGIFRHVYTR
jgi:hypothetical protein